MTSEVVNAVSAGARRMSDLTAREAYDLALSRHMAEIRPALQQIDEKILRTGASPEDLATLKSLRTMRTILLSGLFDDEYYLRENHDAQQSDMGPLEHYVKIGDLQARNPNPLFLPQYYREQAMASASPDSNTLEHYINEGERAGQLPHVHFDPHNYLRSNPAIAEFVDRPLFHFLKTGPAGELDAKTLPGSDWAVRFLASGDPSYPLMMFKQMLARERGVQEGFALYKQALKLPDSDRVRLKRLQSLREVAEQRPGAFIETAPAGERFVVQPPTIIGDGNHRPLEGMARSMFVGCLIDARVRGHSAFIEVDDVALLDFQGDELARIDDQLEVDTAVFHATSETAWIIVPENDGSTIELDEGFALLGPWTREFGHWMWDYLPRYVAALASGALPRVPIIVDADLPKTHRQALELMAPEGVDIDRASAPSQRPGCDGCGARQA